MVRIKPGASRRCAAIIGDVVGSRRSPDRAGLHHRLTEALQSIGAAALDPPALTVGDEFQGTYPTVGAAIDAAFALRLAVSPVIDMRFGIGWGEATILDAGAGIQDGPAWWAAREAIEWTATAQRQPGLAMVRTAFRAQDGHRADAGSINAALLCRDHLIGSLDDRSMRILRGLMDDKPKKDLAAEEAISPSAVSQRAGRDGLDLIVLACEYLRSVP